MVIVIVFSLIAFFFGLCLLFYKFVFLRDPKRSIPSGNAIVAPADGKIIKIIKLDDIDNIKIKKGLVGKIKTLVPDNCKEGYLITIMMNLFNVHIQRAPLSGKVFSVNHSSGTFKNVVYGDKFENGLINEKNEIVIDNAKLGKIKVIQIAGYLARRIECFVKENQKINKGQRIGRILMGSQVSLILPKNTRLLCKIGDNVKSGSTVIAENA